VTKAKALPNGDSHIEPEKQPNGEPREASVSVIEDDLAKADSEQESRDVKEKVAEVVEEAKQAVKVGRKGKKPIKDEKSWPSNGYAFAPRWPQVGLVSGYDLQY
jgi:hypothetical protein